ncbi:MAG: hypothetical protein LC808_01750 [Actinobacteria bacterium]|nr:hypothetical protein [Actinomycetota bacterium]
MGQPAAVPRPQRIGWNPDPPDTDEAEAAMLSVAAHELDEALFSTWLAERVQAL